MTSLPEPAHLIELQAKIDQASHGDERRLHEKAYWNEHKNSFSIFSRLAAAIADVGRSDFWGSVSEALRAHWACGPLLEVEEIICLCLGNLEDHSSIYQLALLHLLSEKLHISHEQCFVFDPCHTFKDRSMLEYLGFTVLNRDDEARIPVARMTLFYMPHGDFHLTENVVQANWHSLHRVAVLGNCFSWVCDADGYSVDELRAPHVQAVLPFVKATDLTDTLHGEMKERLASFAPRAAQLVGSCLVDCLDCSLTTFPPASQWGDMSCHRHLEHSAARCELGKVGQ